MQIFVLIFIFIGVFAAAYLTYPFFEERMQLWQKKRMDKITPKLGEMFIDVSIKKLMILDLAVPVVCAFIAYIFSQKMIFAGAAALFGLVVPIFIVKRLEAQRRKKFASQLVDALMIISSSLKAGLSLLQAFEVVVEEMPAPMSQEFSLVVRQMQMGISLDEAIITMKKRMHIDELDMVVTSMMVARETGGDLTETFSRVVYTIQERNKLIGRVNSLCVQAKLQGVIMSILPFAFAFFVYKTNPHFFDVFFNDDLGKMIFTYAVVSQILGIFFIRKFSKIDI